MFDYFDEYSIEFPLNYTRTYAIVLFKNQVRGAAFAVQCEHNFVCQLLKSRLLIVVSVVIRLSLAHWRNEIHIIVINNRSSLAMASKYVFSDSHIEGNKNTRLNDFACWFLKAHLLSHGNWYSSGIWVHFFRTRLLPRTYTQQIHTPQSKYPFGKFLIVFVCIYPCA